MDVPAGEVGVTLRDERVGQTRICIPVLSVYLDLRPTAARDGRGGDERPAIRPGITTLRGRLRQIERTFWPRGAAFEAVRADAKRVERYVASQVDAATAGVAIFASAPHGLFETVTLDVAPQTEVMARALPDLFQLARALDDQETVVIALAHTNAVRLFVSHRGGLREVQALSDDPKYYHLVHGANAMNQAHYQRHAIATQAAFAREAADQIERLVTMYGAAEVWLAGETRGVANLRRALAPHVAARVRALPHSLPLDAPRDAVEEAVAPLLAEVEAERDRAIIDRLMDAVRAGRLGTMGLASTRRALQRGQVDVLVLAQDTTIAPEARSELIDYATKTDAAIEVVEDSEVLQQAGGVGALLRYPRDVYGQTGPLHQGAASSRRG
jgi:hypothetical protein